ncbi:MAG: hypothetical protein U5L11_02870 [Arhodomonas sp.]|nr:hypothetical protein [Arhodomonas sp.]
MENRSARLTLLIDPKKKAVFERLCAEDDVTRHKWCGGSSASTLSSGLARTGASRCSRTMTSARRGSGSVAEKYVERGGQGRGFQRVQGVLGGEPQFGVALNDEFALEEGGVRVDPAPGQSEEYRQRTADDGVCFGGRRQHLALDRGTG